MSGSERNPTDNPDTKTSLRKHVGKYQSQNDLTNI